MAQHPTLPLPWRKARHRGGMAPEPLPGFAILPSLLMSLMAMLALAPSLHAQNQERPTERRLIREVELEGVTRFSEDELLKYLYMDETSWWAWTGLTDKHYYSRGFAQEDAERITKLYHAYGYHNACVVSITPEPLKPGSSKVRVTIVVEEGEPTLVCKVEVKWPQGKVSLDLSSLMTIKEGKPFEVAAINRSRENILFALQNRGYALARVDERALVDRERGGANVTFSITPGPYSIIGEIEYDGLQGVDREYLDREVAFARGKPYSPTLIKRIEFSLFAMDIFDAVTVVTAKALNEKGRLDLVVRLLMARPQRIKVGFGLGINPVRSDLHGSMVYTHRSLLGQLIRLDLETLAGYAVVPYFWNVEDHGPLLKVTPRFRKKGWLERKLIWTARPSFQVGVEEGYKFAKVSLSIGVSRFLAGFILAEASYNIQFYDFFGQSDLFQQTSTILGPDFRDPFFLGYLELTLKAYFTDRIISPRNGVMVGLTYDLAGFFLGSQFDYNKFTPEFRAYWQVFSHLQIALRLMTGVAVSYGAEQGVPISEKYYLGGGDTIRGWGLRRLSPSLIDCTEDPCERIPVGGQTMVLGNFELRFRTIDQLLLIPFFDVGDVQGGELEYVPSQWNYSAGLGLAYASPIGTFRLDIGIRLNDPERFNHEDRWAFDIVFGEPF